MCDREAEIGEPCVRHLILFEDASGVVVVFEPDGTWRKYPNGLGGQSSQIAAGEAAVFASDVLSMDVLAKFADVAKGVHVLAPVPWSGGLVEGG